MRRSQRRLPGTLAGLPHAFVSYEPAEKLKLICFPDKACLDEILGHVGKKLKDWTPDDRMIDSAGREYRFVNYPAKKYYDIEPTGETWPCEKLLALVEADARHVKRDPASLRQQVNDAPADKKIPILMQYVDHLSAAPSLGSALAIAGFFLFLLLFFVAVVFLVSKVLLWLGIYHTN